MVEDYKKSVKGKIKRFSEYLGQKSWFAGEEVSWFKSFTQLVKTCPSQITFVDFVLYELFDQHRLLDASLLDGFDNVKVSGFIINCFTVTLKWPQINNQ